MDLTREETYSVSRLCGEIRGFLSEAFPEVWVSGEVQRLNPSRAGHLYFELIEKGDEDEIVGKLDAVIWRSQAQRILPGLTRAGQALADGQEIRCRGRVDFYERGGRLQLIVSAVDPSFTLGRLELRRRETVEALRRGDLLQRNRETVLSPIPMTLALVTSGGSAAYHDFVSTLEESGYAFRVVFVHASVQGAAAERELTSALQVAAGLDVDCVAVVRGGGSRSDLAVFDSRSVAEAVARSPWPVVVGLGHQIDRSVVDLVAHTSLRTPTSAAEFLVERVAEADSRLERLTRELRRCGLDHLRLGRELLGRAERGFELVGLRLASQRQRLDYLAASIGRASRTLVRRHAATRRVLATRLGGAAPRLVARQEAPPRQLGARLIAAAERRLSLARERLDAHRRISDGLSPARILERGFSVTRSASGAVVRSPGEVDVGERITTTLAAGELASRVEER